MKEFWRKYFHIPSDGPINDRVLLARLALDIFLIVLYLACMAYAAYALFQYDLAIAGQFTF